MRDRTTSVSGTAVERGSGNVFADLDLPDADSLIVKAELVARIDAIIRRRSITRAEAGRLLGLSRPDVSRLLRGDFHEYSLERLLRLLARLGRDIEIVIRRPRSPSGAGPCASPPQKAKVPEVRQPAGRDSPHSARGRTRAAPSCPCRRDARSAMGALSLELPWRGFPAPFRSDRDGFCRHGLT